MRTEFGYDAASNRTSFTDPESGSAAYAYDTLNRLQTMTPPTAYGTGSFGLGYDALSSGFGIRWTPPRVRRPDRRISLARPNTVNMSYGYDSNGNPGAT
ncbi:MAG: hypothetical protein ACHQT6_00465 [Candidatus Acidiferrales bacterium]